MKQRLLILSLLVSVCCAQLFARSKDETAIRAVLSEQQSAWNQGDLEKYMQGYWHSDALVFIGKNGVTYGWQKTLDNYRKSYPDKEMMGMLSFDILSVESLSKEYYFITGKWLLNRKAGDLSGSFTLLFKKIKGEWKIIKDHSS